MGNRDNEPLQNLSLVKSNEMISAKYKSTLLENQVMAIALTRIEVNAKDKDSPLEARLYPGELKRLVSDPVHIYRDLKSLSQSITGHTMFLEDGNGNFKAFSVVPNAEYKDGVFIIKFNSELKEHILGLERNYTTLELSVMTDFTKNASFRIYELLKKDLYKSKPEINDGRVDVEYNISEFRFMIGLANGDDQGVKNEMARMSKNNINWDVLYQKLDKKDRKYEKWYDLAKYVIKPAQMELEEKSDIRFEYEGIRSGHSMNRIVFHIYKNKPAVEIIEKQKIFEKEEMNRQLELPKDLAQYKPLYDEFIDHNGLTTEDLDILIKKAEYNTERVRRAIELADEQEHINNYMGWIINCIKENYVQVEVIEGDAGKAETARAVERTIAENNKSESVQISVWERTKQREEFNDFVKEIELSGLSMEQLEEIYPANEKVQMFIDWKAGRQINF